MTFQDAWSPWLTYLLLVLCYHVKQTWVGKYDGIKNTELNDVNLNVTEPLNKLQQTRHQLCIPAYVNTLLRRHQQICAKPN